MSQTPPETFALIKRVLDMTAAIEPMVMSHFEDLVMDTEQDEALRQRILDTLQPWAEAVQEFRAWTEAL